jgi:hypothetical protein
MFVVPGMRPSHLYLDKFSVIGREALARFPACHLTLSQTLETIQLSECARITGTTQNAYNEPEKPEI